MESPCVHAGEDVKLNPTFRTLKCHIHPDLKVKKPKTLVLLWFEVIGS
ncbi:MAG: hypothetical protein AB1861_16065 [Cyanobacteriota bacterium]